jgi:Protein of unknown function (DUF1360)
MSVPLYDIAVMALASGRIAYSITQDTIFYPMRDLIFKRSAPEGALTKNGEPYSMLHDSGNGSYEFLTHVEKRESGFFGQLFECPYCMSFWIAHLVVLGYILAGDTAIKVLSGFALWALATLYARYV